jgi:two-component system sensor histidine kinase KdpD
MTTGAAEQLATEADRGRAALLAAVSHDLRAPLVADSLDALGLRARTVLADIPSALRQVMTHPAIMERVIANLVRNALRYSPAASPPLVTARDLGDRVELCVVDHGTGIPEAGDRR